MNIVLGAVLFLVGILLIWGGGTGRLPAMIAALSGQSGGKPI